MAFSGSFGSQSQKTLLDGIASGDIRSFEVVFRLYYAPLVVFAMRWITDRDEAQSIVQDVFVGFWEKRSVLNVRSLVAYLRVSVRNRCMNVLKHRQVVYDYERKQCDGMLSVSHWDDETDEQDNYQMQILQKAIENLPEQRRKVFLLSRVEGKKYREIAEMLNISPKTVEAHMGKALQFLRTSLSSLRIALCVVLWITY